MDEDLKEADQELMNWARYTFDGWLSSGLLWTPPPTSEGYRAPIVAFDEPEPARVPIDELAGQITENIVVQIGGEPGGFDSYRALVHWYPHLMMHRDDMAVTRQQAYRLLAKHMHCSYPGAVRILDYARHIYWTRRFTYPQKKRKLSDGPACPK